MLTGACCWSSYWLTTGLAQLHQAKSALETASYLYESKDIGKALEFFDKVFLIFSPACSKAKLLKVKLLMVSKDYSAAISESGYILKEDENNLEALLLRGRSYYYLADQDVAQRFVYLIRERERECLDPKLI
ncbi:hypothetical protein Bca4012_037912 [Brassica carinata]